MHFENDFSEDISPTTVMEELRTLPSILNIPAEAVVFVAHQYLYRALPEIFRADNYLLFEKQHDEVLKLASNEGFVPIDTSKLMHTHRIKEASLLSPAALNVDHAHLSRKGIELLAQEIQDSAQWNRFFEIQNSEK